MCIDIIGVSPSQWKPYWVLYMIILLLSQLLHCTRQYCMLNLNACNFKFKLGRLAGSSLHQTIYIPPFLMHQDILLLY